MRNVLLIWRPDQQYLSIYIFVITQPKLQKAGLNSEDFLLLLFKFYLPCQNWPTFLINPQMNEFWKLS